MNKNGNNKYLIYAGGVRVLKSTDYKEQNYYTWQVGGQWHFAYYDRGAFYVTGIYSPKFISYGIECHITDDFLSDLIGKKVNVSDILMENKVRIMRESPHPSAQPMCAVVGWCRALCQQATFL